MESVVCFWTVGAGNGRRSSRIRVVPDGCMDIIFDFTGGLAPLGMHGLEQSRPKAFVAGVSMTPEIVGFAGVPRVVGARLRPGRAADILGLPACESAGCSVDLSDILPGVAARAMSYAGERGTPRDMVAAVERVLAECLRKRVPHRGVAAVEHAVRALASGHVQDIDQLAGAMGMSARHLERHMAMHAGLSPKKMHRALRLVRAIRLLHRFPEMPLVRLAHSLGFNDQPHFNREFRALCNVSPGEWLAEQRDVAYLQYCPADLS